MLEPGTPLVWSWHIEVIADHIQATLEEWRAARAAQRPHAWQNLLINVPPGTMKSRIVNVFTPAWRWLDVPDWRSIFIAGTSDLSMRDSILCRQLIESDWYQETFEPTWTMAEDQNAKGLFNNTAGGFRKATSVGAAITGNRGDAVFVDDPNDAKKVHSKAERESVNSWWDVAAGNRLNDLRLGVRVGVMQRLHHEDWSGHVLSGGGWQHLCLPMEFEKALAKQARVGPGDPRTQEGELLFPQRFPADVLEQERKRLGAAGYAGQHQQRPTPATGGLFQRGWWRFWRELPADFDEVVQSWDLTFKGGDGSDYVVGQVWGRKGSSKYLLDQVRARLDFPATLAAIRSLSAKWPQATLKLVEDKANGPAVLATLRSEIEGLVAVEPDGGKEARAHAVAPQVEAGNVLLPDPSRAPWVHDLLEELAAFPRGAHDDQVDALTQALRRLGARSEGWFI